MSDIEYRKAATIGVRERIIDLIAVPYNEETKVLRHGRWVTESVDPEAFAGVRGTVTVNRAHDLESPLGRVLSFHPKDPRGLRTELRISETSAGNDVLALAEDGLLSASIGFRPIAEEWNRDRTAVKITRGQLAHIALTGDPAYPGAKVLAVRESDDPLPRVPTPNLDRLRLEMLAAESGIDLPSTFT